MSWTYWTSSFDVLDRGGLGECRFLLLGSVFISVLMGIRYLNVLTITVPIPRLPVEATSSISFALNSVFFAP